MINKFRNFKKFVDLAFSSTQKKKLYQLLTLMFCGTLLELCGVGLIFPLIKLYTDQEFLNSIYFKFNIGPYDTQSLIIISIVFFVAFFLFKNFFLWIILRKYSFFFANYEAQLQSRLFNGYLNKSVSSFKNEESSKIANDIINISSYFSSQYMNAFLMVSVDIVIQINILILLLYVSWQTTSLIFLIFGSVSYLLYFLSKKKLFEIGSIRNKFSAIQLANVQQAIGGIKEIKLTGRENYFTNEFTKTTDILSEANFKNAVISGTPRFFTEVIAITSIATIVIFLSTIGKQISDIVPILALFMAAAYKLIPSLNKILLMFNRLKLSGDAVNKITQLLIEFDELEIINKNRDLISKKVTFENLTIKNLTFKYYDKSQYILNNININFKKNSFIGIKGESGAGKSTFIDLILGLLRPLKGEILIDNKSIFSVLHDWQRSIGYVPQNIFLSSGSIKKNIAFGIPEDQIDEDLINDVIKKSSLDRFVKQQNNGFNTNIGEGGALISGGQRQRIGIARALYNKPKILIFDEATSALDINTENEILLEMNKLKSELTIISISHRQNTIKYCDEIYNLEDGSLKKID